MKRLAAIAALLLGFLGLTAGLTATAPAAHAGVQSPSAMAWGGSHAGNAALNWAEGHAAGHWYSWPDLHATWSGWISF